MCGASFSLQRRLQPASVARIAVLGPEGPRFSPQPPRGDRNSPDRTLTVREGTLFLTSA